MAVTNSYMLPHGTRCSDSPRVRTPRMWVARPSTVSTSAARTHGPAGAPPARQRLAATAPTAPVPAPPADGEGGAGGEAGGAAAGDAGDTLPAEAVTPAGTATRAGSVTGALPATATASAVLPSVTGR